MTTSIQRSAIAASVTGTTAPDPAPRAGGNVTNHYMVVAAGRVPLLVDDLRPPASANLSMNRTPRAWFAPATDPTSATSTTCWLEITSGSGPCSTKKTKMRDRDLRGFDGWDARTTKGAGFPKGPPPCGPFGRAEGVVHSWMD